MSTRVERALITGASAGLGAEFARQLADRGVDLVLAARRQDALEELATTLPVEVEVMPGDLGTEAGVAAAAGRLADTASPVDLLVNNAGFGAYGPFVQLPAHRHAAMIDLNVRALAELSHVAATGMVARGNGGIINVGSTAGFQPDPFGAVYGGTKAFVRWLSEALYEELRGTGVHVMLLAPGVTETEFQHVADIDVDAIPSVARMTPDTVVAAALEDFARCRPVCIPGWPNQVAGIAADLTPTSVGRRVSALLHRRYAG